MAAVLSLAAYNNAYYARDPDWQNFFSYNKLRAKFNDYGWTSYNPQTAPLFKKVNWSENDHAMIANWFFDNPELYSETRLQQILDGYPWQYARLTPAYWWNFARTICLDRALWGVMLVLPLFLVCSRSRQDRMTYLATAILAITALTSIALFSKLPPSRVYLPLLTFPFILLLLMAGDRMPRQRWGAIMVRFLVASGRWRRRITFRLALVHVLVLIGVLYSVGHLYRGNHRMQHFRSDFLKTLADSNWQNDSLYAVWPSGFRYELISPFDNLSRFSDFHQLVIGWPQRTPIFEAMKRKFNIQDVTRALYERPDVFAVGYGGWHRRYAKYIREHYGVNVDFVWKYGDGDPSDFVAQFERQTRSNSSRTAERFEFPPSRQ